MIFPSPSHSSQSSLSMLSAAPAKMLAKDVFPTPLAPKSTTRYGPPDSAGSPAESVEMNESEDDQLPRLPSDSPAELVQDLEREMQAGTLVRKLSVSRWLPGSQMLQRWSSVCRRRLCRRTLDSMVPVNKLGWSGLTDSCGIKLICVMMLYHPKTKSRFFTIKSLFSLLICLRRKCPFFSLRLKPWVQKLAKYQKHSEVRSLYFCWICNSNLNAQ